MYRFIVPGRPVPKVRMTARSKWYKRAQRSLDYQRTVAEYARAAGIPTLTGPVGLFIEIYVKGERRGDLSNYIKAIEDGLQYGHIIANDRQVVEVTAILRQADDEKAVITISPLSPY